MAFSFTCTNKGCGQFMQPYIDPATDIVYCSACDGSLPQITTFVKQQLKMSKKYRPKKNIPFAVKCDKCGKEDKPLLVNDEDIICKFCKKPYANLSEPFKIVLRDKLKTTDTDI